MNLRVIDKKTIDEISVSFSSVDSKEKAEAVDMKYLKSLTNFDKYFSTIIYPLHHIVPLGEIYNLFNKISKIWQVERERPHRGQQMNKQIMIKNMDIYSSAIALYF
jgi:hypothetical protein